MEVNKMSSKLVIYLIPDNQVDVEKMLILMLDESLDDDTYGYVCKVLVLCEKISEWSNEINQIQLRNKMSKV